MRRTPVALLAAVCLALLAVTGCRRRAGDEGPEEGPVAVVRGCYSLEAAAGDDPGGGSGLPPGALPRMVELDSAVVGTVRVEGDSARPAYRAHSYLGTRRADHPFNRWTHLPGDSLRVDHSGALAGLVLRLAAADSVLSGTVRGFTDVRGEGEEGDTSPTVVRATPARCPGSGR